jgi:N-acetylglucosaminyl-diphospho-decaprenol L-rhamnosyltransferase
VPEAPAARPGPGAPDVRGRVAAVVVDYDAGDLLAACVSSLVVEGVGAVVVVENGDPERARRLLDGAGPEVQLVAPGRNLGYGAGANRGIALSGVSEYVLVCNPDLRVHPGAVGRLAAALDANPGWAIVGPRTLDATGRVYPSVRRFPSMADAAGHALLALVWPDNRFSRRYRGEGLPGTVDRVAVRGSGPPADPSGGEGAGAGGEVDWVSGSCFCARRDTLEELGGFDERYFMFAEDIDLCWRAHEAGWAVGVEPAAVVTHVQGASTKRHPYRMIASHHRSALRFAARRARGAERLALPLAAGVLGVRLVMALADEALRRGAD